MGRELSDHDWSLVCSGLKPLRPMTPAEEVREKDRQRREAEWINRHPFRFLLKFLLALAFLIFSWWNVHRLWVKDMAMPPSYCVP